MSPDRRTQRWSWLSSALAALLVTSLLAGCATFAERTETVQRQFVLGHPDQAYAALTTSKVLKEPRNELLYHLNAGTLLYHMQEPERSNNEFELAFKLSEDARRDWGAAALAQLTNPEVVPYRGEDFELVLLHYYKALNFLDLGDIEAALVEVRRLNIRLAEFNTRYGDHGNRYNFDAFAAYLSGMIYEAAGEPNDAFIAYRNAYEAYAGQYRRVFGVGPSEQLKRDLIRTANRSGLRDEQDYYSERFDMELSPDPPGSGQVVVLWHSGLGPVKTESSINFLVIKGQGGGLAFVNRDLGLAIPFVAVSPNQEAQLQDLRIVRVAFPQYLERPPLLTEGTVSTGDIDRELETVQDINAIAFVTLEDRLVREMAATLLRIAVKQAAEAVARRQNPNLGALMSVVNALSEKADTRNWQTIPYLIKTARLTLPAGTHWLTLAVQSRSGTYVGEINTQVIVRAGETTFIHLDSLETVGISSYHGP